MSALQPTSAHEAVTQKSTFEVPEDKVIIKGEDFSKEVTLDSLCSTLLSTGFQATNVGLAIQEINKMLAWVPSQVDPDSPPKKCKIFLSYTSNMISCGVRETIRFLVQHKLVINFAIRISLILLKDGLKIPG
jgi:deoxyhypusine synthase